MYRHQTNAGTSLRGHESPKTWTLENIQNIIIWRNHFRKTMFLMLLSWGSRSIWEYQTRILCERSVPLLGRKWVRGSGSPQASLFINFPYQFTMIFTSRIQNFNLREHSDVLTSGRYVLLLRVDCSDRSQLSFSVYMNIFESRFSNLFF